jgi:demethylmacrocin O-methyltransferase
VIDDGSHRPQDVIDSFGILFPMLADDGLYVIEDIQTSYWPPWGGSLDPDDPTTSMALVRRLLDGLNHEEFLDPAYRPTYTDEHVVAVHCYHNLVVIEKGENREGSNKRRVNRQWYEENAPEFTEP